MPHCLLCNEVRFERRRRGRTVIVEPSWPDLAMSRDPLFDEGGGDTINQLSRILELPPCGRLSESLRRSGLVHLDSHDEVRCAHDATEDVHTGAQRTSDSRCLPK